MPKDLFTNVWTLVEIEFVKQFFSYYYSFFSFIQMLLISKISDSRNTVAYFFFQMGYERQYPIFMKVVSFKNLEQHSAVPSSLV